MNSGLVRKQIRMTDFVKPSSYLMNGACQNLPVSSLVLQRSLSPLVHCFNVELNHGSAAMMGLLALVAN